MTITPEHAAVFSALAAAAAAATEPVAPPGPVQLTRDDVARMAPGAVIAAQSSGELDTLLGINRRMPPRVSDQQIGSAELARMLPAEITAAMKIGRLVDLLAGRDVPASTSTSNL